MSLSTRRISRPQDIILAPDVDGLTRGFCSEPCLSAFTLDKSADAKALASSDVKLQSACSMCAKYDIVSQCGHARAARE